MDEMLTVKAIPAHIYHYGWVKDPRIMQDKQQNFNKLWHNDKWMEDNIPNVEAFDYFKNIDTLKLFEGTHPKVMQERIRAINWKFNYDMSFNKSPFKQKVKKLLKKIGWDTTYRNYILKK